ncbi:hypothetical protein RFI_38672, partial [Reticulomyxa filosa]
LSPLIKHVKTESICVSFNFIAIPSIVYHSISLKVLQVILHMTPEHPNGYLLIYQSNIEKQIFIPLKMGHFIVVMNQPIKIIFNYLLIRLNKSIFANFIKQSFPNLSQISNKLIKNGFNFILIQVCFIVKNIDNPPPILVVHKKFQNERITNTSIIPKFQLYCQKKLRMYYHLEK